MNMELSEIVKRNCFACFGSLNEAERSVILLGEDAYRESLDLDNDDAPCWKIPSGESTTFVGWNPQCVPTLDYIVWKLENHVSNVRGEIK